MREFKVQPIKQGKKYTYIHINGCITCEWNIIYSYIEGRLKEAGFEEGLEEAGCEDFLEDAGLEGGLREAGLEDGLEDTGH